MKTSCLMRHLLLVASIVFVSGCARVKSEFRPPLGMIYTKIKAPLSIDYDKTQVREHYGESTSMFLMEPFLGTSYAWEECSLETAAKNGKLKSVDYADYEFMSVFGLFGQTTVRAYGEKK